MEMMTMEMPKDWSKAKPVAVGVILRPGAAPVFYGCPAAFTEDNHPVPTPPQSKNAT